MKKLFMMLGLVLIIGLGSASASNTKHKANKKHHAKTEAAAPVKTPARK